jgi:hypothetical protein
VPASGERSACGAALMKILCRFLNALSLPHGYISTMHLLQGRGLRRLARRCRFWATVAIAAAALLASCSSPAEPSFDDLGPVPAGAFTTDATGYLAHRLPGSLPRYQFRIISRFENQGTSTVYLGRCFPRSPQPLFSVVATTSVESGYSQVWACVGHDQQFAVRAGETRVDTLLVEGPNTFQGGTNTPLGMTEGDFRLYFDVRLAAGDGAPSAPDGIKLSNAFRVRTSDSVVP